MDEPDDLERVLGYVDYQPDPAVGAGTPRQIGSDLVVVPFWNDRFCRAILRAAEAVGAFEPQPDDPVPGHEISLAAISPQLYAAVERDLGVRIWPALQRTWPLVDYHGLRDAVVIRYALGEQESLRLHHDVAQVSASVKLNDSYRGGVLEFPRQGSSNGGLAVGELLAWPSLVTHPHATTQLESGVKYALTIWFELPNYLG